MERKTTCQPTRWLARDQAQGVHPCSKLCKRLLALALRETKTAEQRVLQEASCAPLGTTRQHLSVTVQFAHPLPTCLLSTD